MAMSVAMEREDIIAALVERTGLDGAALENLPHRKLGDYFNASAALQPEENEIFAKTLIFIGSLPCAQGDWILGTGFLVVGVWLGISGRTKAETNRKLAQTIMNDPEFAKPAPKSL